MHCFKFVLQFVFGLSDKLMGAVNTFKTGNYSRQPVAASWFLNSVDLPFFMEIKYDVIKGTISAKLSESFNCYRESILCHSCRFDYQQRLLNTFPGPGHLHPKDGVV